MTRPEAWLTTYLRLWGVQTWRRWTRRDGWPPKTVLGRVIDEGFTGAAQGYTRGHYIEGYTGEALEVHLAMDRLIEDSRTMLTVHYVIPLPAIFKAHRMSLKRSTYYARLNVAEADMLRSITAT